MSLQGARTPLPPLEIQLDAWDPPKEFEEYRLLRPIGRGRTGRVWLAHDLLLDRRVAVKFIPAMTSTSLSRFLVEARAGARLQHPNVATLYRVGQLDDRGFLVSEFVPGVGLDRIKKPLAWERALRLGLDVARGLAAAHRRGVLHRDVKPGNAVLAETGEVKLLDFGLAKMLAAPRARNATPSTGAPGYEGPLVADEGLVGTPQYMAPEAWRGEGGTVAADLYSLGVLLFELCAGRRPFEGVGVADMPQAHASREAPPLLSQVATVDARFAAAVDRLLRRDPTQRYASADEVLDALEPLASRRTHAPIPDGNPYRGLARFDVEHRALFFGRSRDVRTVVERLRGEAFVLVTGDSGVGKSSLCCAGIIPAVTDGGMEDRRAWSVARMVPGTRPRATLAAALAPILDEKEGILAERLVSDSHDVARRLRARLGETAGLLVFVDQLEELVTLSPPAEAQLVARALAELGAGLPGIRVLGSARSDFLTRLAGLPALGDPLRRAIYLIAPLGPTEIREAIIGPARLKGASFESEDLVDTLVTSTVAASGGLPLLQFALAELWEVRTPGAPISRAALDGIGGVEGALARHGDAVLAGMLLDEKHAARMILSRLVTLEGTRARRREAELVASGNAAKKALEALVRGRLLVVHESTEGPVTEIAHEALLRGWGTLATWLAEDEQERELHGRLERAAIDWERLGRRREGLWGARALAEVERLPPARLSERERDFVAASERARGRARLVALGIAGGVVVLLAGFAWGYSASARLARRRAVASLVATADKALGEARALAAERDRARADAFAKFDAGTWDAAETSWTKARDTADRADARYDAAVLTLEQAMLLEGVEGPARERFADALYERAVDADRMHRLELRDELLERMRLYDAGGVRAQRWSAPTAIAVTTEPAGATLTVSRYVVEPSGRRRAETVTTITTPATVALPRGSYLLDFEHAGDAPTRLPLVVEAGAPRSLDVPLAPAASVPRDFVYVPAGRFVVGTYNDGNRSFFATVPAHTTSTPAYLMAAHETTFGDWLEYLRALPPDERARHTPRVTNQSGMHGQLDLVETGGVYTLRLQPALRTYSAREGEPIRYAGRDRRAVQDWRRFPVGGIDWNDAQAYVKWLDATGRVPGARLCSELEWERAARGADEREYPQGDTLAPDDANFDATYGKNPLAFGPDEVGSHPESRSPFGIDDLAGNVWEWTRSSFKAEEMVARGGSYYFAAPTLRSVNRELPEPTLRDPTVGLRVCASIRFTKPIDPVK